MTRDEAKEVAARIGAKFARAAYLRRQVKSFEAELAKIEKEIVDSQVHAANAGEVFAEPEPEPAAEESAPRVVTALAPAPIDTRRLALEWTEFKTIQDVYGETFIGGWDDLVGMLCELHVVEQKNHAPCWSPAVFTPGASRSREAVVKVRAIVFDLEGVSTTTLERSLVVLRERGWASVVHRTWSDGLRGFAYARVVIAVSRPMTPAEYREMLPTAAEAFPHEASLMRDDVTIPDPSRIYFMPSRREGRDAPGAVVIKGAPIDVDASLRRTR